MALYKFTQAILQNKKIEVFNHGNHMRDFTYIDDIVLGIIKVIDSPAKKNPNWKSNNPSSDSSNAPWRIYNIGNNKKINLIEYITALETELNMKAKKEFLPMQKGDVPDTHADVSELASEFDYHPNTSIQMGIKKFVSWFKFYHQIS